MIFLDQREGGSQSPEIVPKLVASLRSHRLHPPVTSAFLHAGDFLFTGSGPTGPVSIGIERKKIPDFFHSLHSGRLMGEQLPKLIDLCEFRYLILEGQTGIDWRTGEILYWETGELEEDNQGVWQKVSEYRKLKQQRSGQSTKREYTGEELLGAMETIGLFTPVKLVRTFGTKDTLDLVATLWHLWQKPFSKRGSHSRVLYTPQTTISLGKASFIRRASAQLSKVGWDKSGIIEQNFTSLMGPGGRPMCKCPECGYGSGQEVWEKLPGFGKVLSERVVNELSGINHTGD